MRNSTSHTNANRLPLRMPRGGLLAVVLAVASAACTDSFERTRQLRTFVVMRGISQSITEAASKHGGAISPEQATRIIQAINPSTDEWGRAFIFAARGAPPRFSFLLVSCGSDRRLDVPSVTEYFALAKVDIRGITWHDIVFRDGEAITNASKEPSPDYPPYTGRR